jgi:hypothetical protein
VSETEGENEYIDEYEDGWLMQVNECDDEHDGDSGSEAESEEEGEEDQAEFTDGVPSSDTEPLTDHDSDVEGHGSDVEGEEEGAVGSALESVGGSDVQSEVGSQNRIKAKDQAETDDVISIISDI